MGSNAPLVQKYTRAELGITTSTDGQLHISIDSPLNLGLDELKLAFDHKTRKWKVLPSVANSSVNGDVASSSTTSNSADDPSSNWFDTLPDTDHVNFFRQKDWSSTPLGPLKRWPIALQTLVQLLMSDSTAAALYWGPELSAIYNAEMVKLNRVRLSRNDDSMGLSFKDIWPDVWSDFKPMLDDVTKRGVPLDTLDVTLFPIRNGIKEETFWTGSFLPARDEHGTIRGLLNRGRETTKEVVADRRTKTLNAIALPPSRGGDYVWEHLFNAFRANNRDFPMAFAYKASDETDGSVILRLQQGIGLPKDGHPLVPQELDLFEGNSGFIPYFRRAKSADRPLLLHKSTGTLPSELVDGFDWLGFEDPADSIAIIAINTSDRLLGMIVVALSPRRPYDIEYEGFLNSLSRHTSAIITNAIDKEEANSRAERLGRQLEDSEKQIREIAIHGPVGMVQVALNGKILWANDQFYELTGHSRKAEDQYELSFMDIVEPDDLEACAKEWTAVTQEQRVSTCALRLKRRWKPPAGPFGQEQKEEPMWITSSGFPIMENGELKYIAAAITDISHFKWAEATQSRNATAAKEAKRLQENFIDIVSHEMRNPLSAITQLADAISTSFLDLDGSTDFEKARTILDDNIESAKTILMCASHQKRIIDDVLTLSKLDSMMLSITPVVVQPVKVVESALKMFEGEFQTNKIEFHSSVDQSYSDLEIDWIYLDPSRLTQIFINLITNAIKFTKSEKRRLIKVRTRATLTRPPTIAGVTWFPTHKKYKDLTQSKEWGIGQEVFFCFEVQDTGRGLEQEEMQKLFGRFQQATAQTHIKYGGSGLGLFISRELTETQGGEIGVSSKPGKGSTFAFYIKGRRAEPPDEPAPILPTLTIGVHSPERQLERTSSGDEATTPPENMVKSKPRLLLVEDNVVNAKVLTRQLERAKCEVYLANHGMEAIDFLSRTRIWKETAHEPQAVEVDCVLMDMEMPIMDGLTCTRRIRQFEKEGLILKHINIIAITANSRQEQIDTALNAGADGVLSKPFLTKDLLAKIEEVTTKKQDG